jgi:hypothetical protein
MLTTKILIANLLFQPTFSMAVYVAKHEFHQTTHAYVHLLQCPMIACHYRAHLQVVPTNVHRNEKCNRVHTFNCGTDSPVNMDSSTIQGPRSNSKSHGTRASSSAPRPMLTMSPGTKSSVLILIHFRLRYAYTNEWNKSRMKTKNI